MKLFKKLFDYQNICYLIFHLSINPTNHIGGNNWLVIVSETFPFML